MATRAARLRAARRRRPDHPVELPAADAGLEDRARRSRRATRVVLKPAEFTLADRACLRRDLCARPACRRAWSTSSPATARPAPRSSTIPDVDKIAFTGSTEVGRDHPQRHRRQRQAALARARRQVARSSSSTTPTSTAPSRAWSTRSGSTRARSAAPARACWCRRRSPSASSTKLRARMETLRVGDPLDKAIDIGAIVAPVQLERITRLVEAGRRRGRDDLAAVVGRARPTAASTRRRCSPTSRPPATIAQVEIFGPVLVAMTLPHARRGGRARQQHALRPGRQRLDREHQPRARRRAARSRPASVWINCTNLFDAASGFGGYRESGFGREGGTRGHVRVREAAPGASASQAAGRANVQRAGRRARIGDAARIDRTAKLYIGGKQARPDSGYSRTVHRPRRRAASARSARATARTSATPSRRRTRPTGWADATAHNRAQILYYIAENLSARADEFAAPHRRA